MSLEIHINTRLKLLPDPEFDGVASVFYHVWNDIPEEVELQTTTRRKSKGIITVNFVGLSPERNTISVCGIDEEEVILVEDERSLYDALVEMVQAHDPDIIMGYEAETLSLGYLVKRAAFLDIDLAPKLSRLPGSAKESRFNSNEDFASAWNDKQSSNLSVAGRVILNIWRLMRAEIAVTSFLLKTSCIKH